MKKVEVSKLSDLRERIDELIRLVEEKGETIELTRHGKAIAHMVPIDEIEQTDERASAATWINLKRLSAELSSGCPADVSSVEVIRDVRREL